MTVFPLIFEPIFKPKLWGGRRLESLAGKRLPPNVSIGESWEIADLEEDQSVVAAGPAKGKTLGELVRLWDTELTGRAPLVDGRFPLLIKYLDAAEALSVQVHPNEAAARRLGGRVRVKHEAWYILDAEADACIYRGLRAGVDADALRRAVKENRVESVLYRVPVRKGQSYYLPGGTVHAIGAGVVVAEVQTPSDVTYRLYDWGRLDPVTGRPRKLHIEEALACASCDPPSLAHEQRQHVASLWTSVTQLVRCDSFVIERVRMIEGVEQEIPYEELVIWIVLEGRGSIRCGGLTEPFDFGVGDTVLIPAGLKNGRVQVHDNCMWLEVTVPVASSLAGFERPDRASLRTSPGESGDFVPLNVPWHPT